MSPAKKPVAKRPAKKAAAKKAPAKKAPAKKAAAKKAAAKKPAGKKAAAAREMRSCRMCGAMAECVAGGIPPGWSFSSEPGGVTSMCDQCARRNIRSIEGKLSFEWWE